MHVTNDLTERRGASRTAVSTHRATATGGSAVTVSDSRAGVARHCPARAGCCGSSGTDSTDAAYSADSTSAAHAGSAARARSSGVGYG